MSEGVSFEVRLANGDKEVADSLWGARHVVARRAAFDKDPLRPVNALPRAPQHWPQLGDGVVAFVRPTRQDGMTCVSLLQH
jgi:hypothetical protein